MTQLPISAQSHFRQQTGIQTKGSFADFGLELFSATMRNPNPKHFNDFRSRQLSANYAALSLTL